MTRIYEEDIKILGYIRAGVMIPYRIARKIKSQRSSVDAKLKGKLSEFVCPLTGGGFSLSPKGESLLGLAERDEIGRKILEGEKIPWNSAEIYFRLKEKGTKMKLERLQHGTHDVHEVDRNGGQPPLSSQDSANQDNCGAADPRKRL